MKKVKARKDAVSGTATRNVEAWLRSMPGCTVIQGHARFLSANTVETGPTLLSADKIFINVGGRAIVPEIPGLESGTTT